MDVPWKIHKQGKETVTTYGGFGAYDIVKAPLCAGARGLYRGNRYHVHRNWKYVTCKKCLKMRGK